MKNQKQGLYTALTKHLKSNNFIYKQDFDHWCRQHETYPGEADWFIDAVKQSDYVTLIKPGNGKADYYVLSMRAYLNFTQEENIKSSSKMARWAIGIAVASLVVAIISLLAIFIDF